jgi:threonine dehydratase
VEDLPEVDEIFVPVGNGALIGGLASGVRFMKASVGVTGVQPDQAPAMVRSFQARRPVSTDSCDTIADGLASRIAIPQSVALMCEVVDRMIEASEQSILAATRFLLEEAHVLCEPSAAASLAGAFSRKEELSGKKIVLIITGANMDRTLLIRCHRESEEKEPCFGR